MLDTATSTKQSRKQPGQDQKTSERNSGSLLCPGSLARLCFGCFGSMGHCACILREPFGCPYESKLWRLFGRSFGLNLCPSHRSGLPSVGGHSGTNSSHKNPLVLHITSKTGACRNCLSSPGFPVVAFPFLTQGHVLDSFADTFPSLS